jgi:hypothetical protein
MTEQPGRPDQADKDRPGQAKAGQDRPGQAKAGQGRPASARTGPGGGSATGQSGGAGRPGGPGRPGPSVPGADMLSEFQRWLIRSSARSMRREIGGQVRKTLGGARAEKTDVWDTATTEIPPEVGEAPECQWCPICRAARQLRDSGPGVSGHLAGAGNVVASAVQDAINALDTMLAKASGTADRDRPDRASPEQPSGAGKPAGAPSPPIAVTPAPIVVTGADSPETAKAAAGPGRAHGEPDSWSLATDRAEAEGNEGPAGAEADRRGHEPDDRG